MTLAYLQAPPNKPPSHGSCQNEQLMRYTALCIATTELQTRMILSQLECAGFNSAEVSLIAAPPVSAPTFAPPCDDERSIRSSAHSVGAGSLMGAAVGLMAGLITIFIPGLGVARGSGPLITAIMAAENGRVGTALGTFGMPEGEAWGYEDTLWAGTALISVHLSNSYEIDTVLAIFHEAGAYRCTHVADGGQSEADAAPRQQGIRAEHPRTAILAERQWQTS